MNNYLKIQTIHTSKTSSIYYLKVIIWILIIKVIFAFILCMKVKVAQLYLTLCDPMDYTVHGILQARILEWVAFPFSGGSSQPRDQTQVSHIAGRFVPAEPRPRTLEWVAYPFSSGSSRSRNWTGVSCIAGGFFTSWATKEALKERCTRTGTWTLHPQIKRMLYWLSYLHIPMQNTAGMPFEKSTHLPESKNRSPD